LTTFPGSRTPRPPRGLGCPRFQEDRRAENDGVPPPEPTMEKYGKLRKGYGGFQENSTDSASCRCFFFIGEHDDESVEWGTLLQSNMAKWVTFQPFWGE